MGGGAAMRTATKLVGIGAAAAGGIKGLPPTEHSIQNVSRPVSAALSSSLPSQMTKTADEASLHAAASWEFDDWELAGDDNDPIVDAGRQDASPTRLVFGGVPRFQEAKVATSELKDAIDKIYLSANSSPISQVSVLSPIHSELGTDSCVVETITISSSVPIQAFQAFQLLSSSPEAQTVVASIASDPNVWNAMMQNPVLKDFFQSQNEVAGIEEHKILEEVEELSDSELSETGFTDYMSTMLNKTSLTIAEMLSSMSTYLQSIFGKSYDEADAAGITKANFMNPVTVSASFIGLAMMVVIVVLLKRSSA